MMKPLIKRLNAFCLPIKLNGLQKKYISIFNYKMDKGIYKTDSFSCLCGGKEDVLIGLKDRYGFNINTVLCKNCGLMRADPYYDDKTLIQFYNEEYRSIYVGSETCSEVFFNDQIMFGENIFSFIKEFLPQKKRLKVYEIGCGAGGILYAFHKNGHDVYGVDYGQEYLQYGIDKGLKLYKGSIDELYKFGRSDLIILNHVFEHFKYPFIELKKIKELLFDDGMLYIALPGLDVIGKWYNCNILEYLQNAHAYHYNLNTLTKTLSVAGYKRLKGNHFIQTLFVNSDVVDIEEATDSEEYKQIIKTLMWFEFLYNHPFLLRLKKYKEKFINKFSKLKNLLTKLA